MIQSGFFDLDDRYKQLSAHGDPLERLNSLIDWKIFMPLIKRAFSKQRKSNAGRKPYNRLMMFKVLVLQSLYNLSDSQLEYQIRDRLSFMRFLDLHLESSIPDEKTIWAFREALSQSGMIERLFKRFDQYLNDHGLISSAGMIVDASIVEAPRQRNNRKENEAIKKGDIPAAIKTNPNRLRQKDMNARWAVKRGQYHYGYKDHIQVDVKHKLVRNYVVTPASTGDITCLGKLIHGQRNVDRKLWADSAYNSEETDKLLSRYQIDNRVSHRIKKGNWISKEAARENSRRSKVRKRVEHIFGFIENSMGGKFIRSVGITRAKAKVGLMNLIYNMCRFEQIHRLGVA